MTAAEINARAIMDALKTDNPTFAQIETALRMIRDGDLVHVDLIPAWVMGQDMTTRHELFCDLRDLAAEEEHMERQRAGWPVMGTTVTEYAAHCIRQAGRGELLGDA